MQVDVSNGGREKKNNPRSGFSCIIIINCGRDGTHSGTFADTREASNNRNVRNQKNLTGEETHFFHNA
jgi:hypothetical protein